MNREGRRCGRWVNAGLAVALLALICLAGRLDFEAQTLTAQMVAQRDAEVAALAVASAAAQHGEARP